MPLDFFQQETSGRRNRFPDGIHGNPCLLAVEGTKGGHGPESDKYSSQHTLPSDRSIVVALVESTFPVPNRQVKQLIRVHEHVLSIVFHIFVGGSLHVANAYLMGDPY